jgi:uncharacterized CHY-type Zn-finger protein
MMPAVADTGRPRIHGVKVDAQGRCAHWKGPGDVVAIRFRCCDRYFACYDCHRALADHPAERWPSADFAHPVVLCGVCGARLPVARYLASSARCPVCDVAFNPRCVLHHHLYFDVPAAL